MRFCNLFVLLTLYFVYCRCDEKIEDDTNGKEEDRVDREGKQLIDKVEQGGWRTISPQEWRSSDEWIPREDKPVIINKYLDIPPRRRRIRKRKRRPSVEDPVENSQPKLSLHTLEDADDIWMEMDDESVKVPHSRRRIVPVYLSDLDEHEDRSSLYEKVRDPFTALEEVEAKSRLKKKSELAETTTTTRSNLKAILKQSGGSLNLSELLQRKNLSLADLLNGKQQAISALIEKTEISTESIKKPTKLPNSDSQSTSQHFEPSSAFKQDIQNSVQNDVSYRGQITNNLEITTEHTTENRIFVPTYPKIIPFHYKHSTVKVTSTSGPVTISTIVKNSTRTKFNEYRTKFDSLRQKLHNSLPVTSAKLNRSSNSANNKTPQRVTTPIPLQAYTIDLEELFGFSQIVQSRNKSTEDAPLYMKIDVSNVKIPTENSTSDFKISTLEKLKPLNARDEIMEVLKDYKSRQNLSRILLLRNMTIEELVAQRERGSSQIHLADIFHNQTREPEPPNEPHVGIISEHGGRKSKTLQNSMAVSSSPIDLNPLEHSNKPTYTVTSFPTYKIAMDKFLQQNNSAPFQLSVWRTLYPNLYGKNVSKEMEGKGIVSEGKADVDEVLHNDVHMVENVENTISEAINHKFNVEVIENNNYEDENNFLRLPSGVKSAIIASTALVALSLLVFLTILIICKWSNKKKKRLCYSDVYSGSRIKSPILETRPKRTIRTIMNETLGRNKSYSNVYSQNISDYFWESDKKPFQ